MFKKIAMATVALCTLGNAAVAKDLSSMSWDEIVAQAKQEGELTWYVWYLQDGLRKAAKVFEEKYGIDVTIPEGTNDANVDKLLAERSRETGDIDVMAFGFDSISKFDMDSLFVKVDAILPPDAGRTYKLAGVDGKGYAVAYWGNQSGLAYDPAKVSEDALPQNPEDLAKFWKDNPEKFGFNYQKGGSGPSFFENTLRVLSDVDFYNGEVTDEKIAGLQAGIDFFNEHAENYVVTASNADSITRISDGELWMAPAWEDHLAGLQKRGEVRTAIKFYIPKMGMNGGGNGVGVPVNAAHPAAALLFVNWLASAQTQSAFNRDFGTAPMHADADDSHALVSNAERAYRTQSPVKPFEDAVKETFIENVILER
jgi:putative spermidine/putrescine transport system substrate-binding protein